MEEKEMLLRLAEYSEKRQYEVKYSDYAKQKDDDGKLIDEKYINSEFVIIAKPLTAEKYIKYAGKSRATIIQGGKVLKEQDIDIFKYAKSLVENDYIVGWLGLKCSYLNERLKDLNLPDGEIKFGKQTALGLICTLPHFATFIIYACNAFRDEEQKIEEEQKKIS